MAEQQPKYANIPQCTDALIGQNVTCKAPNDGKIAKVTLSDGVSCIVENVGQEYRLKPFTSREGSFHEAWLLSQPNPEANPRFSSQAKLTVFRESPGRLQNYASPDGFYFGVMEKDRSWGRFLWELHLPNNNHDASREYLGEVLAKAGVRGCLDKDSKPIVPVVNGNDVRKMARVTIVK